MTSRMNRPEPLVLAAGQEPPPSWCRQVSRRAKFVWIRIEGMFALGPRQRANWEQAVDSWQPIEGRATSGVVTIKLTGVRRLGIDRYRLLNQWLEHGKGVRETIIAIRRLQSLPIGMFVEDFGARVLMEADVIPICLIMDNPLISRRELITNRVFSGHGFIRSSHWGYTRDEMSGWRLPFDLAELVEMHHPLLRWGVRGEWDRIPAEVRKMTARLLPSYAMGGE